MTLHPSGSTRTFFKWKNDLILCCCPVAQSCPNLCDPMDCSTPDFPDLHYLSKFAQTHSIESVMFTNPQSFPVSGSFPNSRLYTSGGQRAGAAASASVLPVNIQAWFHLGLTGLISLQSKGLKSSPAPQYKSINSSVLSLLNCPALISVYDIGKTIPLNKRCHSWRKKIRVDLRTKYLQRRYAGIAKK